LDFLKNVVDNSSKLLDHIAFSLKIKKKVYFCSNSSLVVLERTLSLKKMTSRWWTVKILLPGCFF